MAATLSLQQDLYGIGTHPGNGVPWVAGKTKATVKAMISDEDAASTANKVTLVLEASFNNGQSYVFQGSASWTGGGALPGSPTVPSVDSGYAGSGQVPTHVRGSVSLPNSLSIGTTVDFS